MRGGLGLRGGGWGPFSFRVITGAAFSGVPFWGSPTIAAHRRGMTTQQWFHITRTQAMSQNISEFMRASGAGLAAVTNRGQCATLLLVRTDHGLDSYLAISVPDPGRAAMAVASAVGGRATPIDQPTWIDTTSAIVQLEAKRDQSLLYSMTQAGAEPWGLISSLAHGLAPGSWLAIVVRRPGALERRWWARFVRTVRGGVSVTHYSTSTNVPLIGSIYAGAASVSGAESVAETFFSGLPGFDIDVTVRRLSRARTAAAWIAGAAVAGVAAWAHATYLVGLDWDYAHLVREYAWVGAALWGVAAILAVVGAGVWAGALPSYERRVRKGGPVPPPHRLVPARKDKTREDGTQVAPHYPLHARSLLLAPHMAMAAVAPQSGGLSGGSTTSARPAPSMFRERIGPFLGVADGRPVYLPSLDAGRGIAILGSPGMGKSVLMQGLVGHEWINQTTETGRRNAVIVFEPKADGVSEYVALYQRVCATGRPNPLYVIALADPAAPVTLSVIPHGASPQLVARMLTDGLKYSAEDGSIGSASTEMLLIALTAAGYVDEDVLAHARGGFRNPAVFASGKSVITYAHLLLTGAGDEAAVHLGKALEAKLTGDGATDDMKVAGAGLETIFGKHTPAQRDAATKAPRNKLKPNTPSPGGEPVSTGPTSTTPPNGNKPTEQ